MSLSAEPMDTTPHAHAPLSQSIRNPCIPRTHPSPRRHVPSFSSACPPHTHACPSISSSTENTTSTTDRQACRVTGVGVGPGQITSLSSHRITRPISHSPTQPHAPPTLRTPTPHPPPPPSARMRMSMYAHFVEVVEDGLGLVRHADTHARRRRLLRPDRIF